MSKEAIPFPTDIKIVNYGEPSTYEDRLQIWEALEGIISQTTPPELLMIHRAYQYVDLFKPERPDIATWTGIKGTVFGEEATAVVMQYHGKEEPIEAEGGSLRKRRSRFFPVGNRQLCLYYLQLIANRPSLLSRELRVVWPESQFSEAEIPGIFGRNWKLKQYPSDGAVEKHNPQTVTRMGLISQERGELDIDIPPRLPERFSFRGLVQGDREAQYRLLKHYPLHSFRDSSFFNNTHIVATAPSGQIVASAGIIAQAGKVYILGDTVTDPNYRELGIAKALIYRLIRSQERICSISNFPAPVFGADAINKISQEMLEHLGFTQSGRTFWSVHEKKSWI